MMLIFDTYLSWLHCFRTSDFFPSASRIHTRGQAGNDMRVDDRTGRCSAVADEIVGVTCILRDRVTDTVQLQVPEMISDGSNLRISEYSIDM